MADADKKGPLPPKPAPEVSPQSRFASELWDGFEALCKHTGNEIQFCKGLLEFLKKRIKIEEEYSKSLQKLVDKKQEIFTKGTVARAWDETLAFTSNTSNAHLSVVSQVNEKVVEATQSLIRDLEASRKQLVAEGNQLNSEYANNVKELEKTKQNYEKLCKEAEIAQKTYEAAKSEGKSKDLLKMEKDVTKKQQTAAVADEAYKKKVEEVNSFLENYYTEDMPKILTEFEQLEIMRVHMLKVNLKKFVGIMEMVPPQATKFVQTLLESVDSINVDSEIDAFVAANRTDKQIPDPFEYESYKEGNVQAKKVNRSFLFPKRKFTPKVAPPVTPPTAVFGISLEKAMEKQVEKYPHLEVPRVIPSLIEAITKLDGVKSEGIFRIPAPQSELRIVKEKIDQGVYDIASLTANVHVPCALLKLLLRDLPEPLIPSSLYEACIDNPETWQDILSKLPLLNLQTVVYVINFLQTLIKPEYIEATKMDADNLAMVFAPSFLRCPYTDYNKVLSAADKEKAFIMKLIVNIKPTFQGIPISANKEVPTETKPSESEVSKPAEEEAKTNVKEEIQAENEVSKQPVEEEKGPTIQKPLSPAAPHRGVPTGAAPARPLSPIQSKRDGQEGRSPVSNVAAKSSASRVSRPPLPHVPEKKT